MCCFRLHFPDLNVFFQKKIKILLQFTFEKTNLLCKKREKNNSSRGKIPAPPPPGYQMVRPLVQNNMYSIFQNYVQKTYILDTHLVTSRNGADSQRENRYFAFTDDLCWFLCTEKILGTYNTA